MKTLLLILTACSSTFFYSQNGNLSYLDINNINAKITDTNTLFNSNDSFGFEFPINSNKELIFSAGFWYMGQDNFGLYKGFAEKFSDSELYAGTLSSNPNIPALPVFAKINRAEIENFIIDFNSGTVNPINYPNVYSWPAHGDVTLGYDQYLAPFYDFNNDGNYNPDDGDYPCIKGDQAIFMIRNDKGPHLGSNIAPAILEIHYLIYAYEDGLNANSVFIDLTLINKSQSNYINGYLGFFIDADIGLANDDYFGSNSTENVMYFYNAQQSDNFYGDTLPVLAFKSLKSDLSSAISFTNGAGIGLGDPSTPQGYWNNLNGLYSGGNTYTDISNNPSTFMYDAYHPGVNIGSEIYLQHQYGDRRGVASIPINQLLVNERRKETYVLSAVFPTVSNDNDAGFPEIYDVLNAAEQRYQNELNGCYDQFSLSADNDFITPLELELFPNPVTNVLKVKSNVTLGKVTVYNIQMKRVQSIIMSNNQINMNQFPNGIYFIEFENVGIYKIVKR